MFQTGEEEIKKERGSFRKGVVWFAKQQKLKKTRDKPLYQTPVLHLDSKALKPGLMIGRLRHFSSDVPRQKLEALEHQKLCFFSCSPARFASRQ